MLRKFTRDGNEEEHRPYITPGRLEDGFTGLDAGIFSTISMNKSKPNCMRSTKRSNRILLTKLCLGVSRKVVVQTWIYVRNTGDTSPLPKREKKKRKAGGEKMKERKVRRKKTTKSLVG